MALDESAMSRQHAIEHARSTGILGSSGDFGSGFDSANIWAGRKIVSAASIRLVVSAYDPARRDLERVIAGTRGYVASTVVHHRQDAQSDATIAVRVPADHVQSFVAQLAKLGEVVRESSDASEITADYTDTAARLASAKTLEKRLLQLVAEGRGKIVDVLSVERELARVRGDIEALEAKIRQWDDLVAMATVAVELTTKKPELAAPPPPPSPTFGDRVDGAFHDSIDSVRAAGVWLALTGIAVFPWLVLAIPGIVLLRRWTRRIRLPWAIARRVPAPAGDAAPPVEAAASPSEAAAALDGPIPPP
jgi:acetolactate synthase small subunit